MARFVVAVMLLVLVALAQGFAVSSLSLSLSRVSLSFSSFSFVALRVSATSEGWAKPPPASPAPRGGITVLEDLVAKKVDVPAPRPSRLSRHMEDLGFENGKVVIPARPPHPPLPACPPRLLPHAGQSLFWRFRV